MYLPRGNQSLPVGMKSRLAPATHVMAIRGVKNLALALLAHPGPRLLVAELQHGAVAGQAIMDIRFIPCLEALEATHQRMVGLGDGGGELAGLMRFEMAAHQF